MRAQGQLQWSEAITAPPPPVSIPPGAQTFSLAPADVLAQGAATRDLTPPPRSVRTHGEARPGAADRLPPGRNALLPGEPPSRPSDPPRTSAPPESAPRASVVADPPPPSRAVRRSDRALSAVDALGATLGALAPAMGLVGPIADVLRAPLVFASWGALAIRVGRSPRDAADPHPLVVLGPPAAAVATACWAQAAHDPHAVSIAALAGLSCCAAIAVERLVRGARAQIRARRDRVARGLDLRVRAIQGDETVDLPAAEVRPGEQVVVEAGEVIGVDAAIVAGEARVVPWLDADTEVLRREGEPVVAGARVVSSRLRMITTWSANERAWVKLLSTPATRVDVAAPIVRALRHAAERGPLVAAVLAALAAIAGNATPVEVAAAMAAAAMVFGAKAAPSFLALHFARAHLAALGHGIAYKDARAFERAGGTEVAVLSARGTVLLGEPEIVAVEPINGRTRERPDADGDDVGRVLSLAAGAETASSEPFAAAILRAARTAGVRPDHVRNATPHAGLGVTALASTGERLVVGGRAIMLEQKIGVAMADTRVTELEAQGRSVLLVALGERVVGLIALQDGLRAGARAAVQRLLDARIEPVLLSGEARDTCETIGRALDIDHVRPEVLPGDRGAEVHALSEGGSVVAVIGHPSLDDGALGAADVAVAVNAAGSTPGEWAIALASDDVRDAARALSIPRAARSQGWVAIGLAATPGVIALLTVGFGIAPLAVTPLATLLGALAAWVFYTNTE
jgi:cation transport ATPase